MYKNKVYVLIYLSMVLPVLLSAGALERYTVPKKQMPRHKGYSVQPKTTVSESMYIAFKKEVLKSSIAEKKEMIKYYIKKMEEAVREKNFDAAIHYGKLIGILKEEMIKHYLKKLEEASREKNFDAVSRYGELIRNLNSN